MLENMLLPIFRLGSMAVGIQAMEDFTPGDIDGRMIVFDANTDGLDELYRREITVTPNTEYRFEFAMTTMYDLDTGICPGT